MKYVKHDLLSRAFKYVRKKKLHIDELSDSKHTLGNCLPLPSKFGLKFNFKTLVSDQSLIQLRS